MKLFLQHLGMGAEPAAKAAANKTGNAFPGLLEGVIPNREKVAGSGKKAPAGEADQATGLGLPLLQKGAASLKEILSLLGLSNGKRMAEASDVSTLGADKVRLPKAAARLQRLLKEAAGSMAAKEKLPADTPVDPETAKAALAKKLAGKPSVEVGKALAEPEQDAGKDGKSRAIAAGKDTKLADIMDLMANGKGGKKVGKAVAANEKAVPPELVAQIRNSLGAKAKPQAAKTAANHDYFRHVDSSSSRCVCNGYAVTHIAQA